MLTGATTRDDTRSIMQRLAAGKQPGIGAHQRDIKLCYVTVTFSSIHSLFLFMLAARKNSQEQNVHLRPRKNVHVQPTGTHRH